MKYLRAGLASLLLAVAVPNVSQGVPNSAMNSLHLFQPTFSFNQQHIYTLHAQQAFTTQTSHVENIAALFPALAYQQQEELALHWRRYNLATSPHEQETAFLQIYPLALEDASRKSPFSDNLAVIQADLKQRLSLVDKRAWEKAQTAFENSQTPWSSAEVVIAHLRKQLHLVPWAPEREGSVPSIEDIIVENIAEDFEQRLGYSLESGKYHTVTKTLEGYVIHDLVEHRLFSVPYHFSLEVSRITDENGKPLFEADLQGNLVPMGFLQEYLTKEEQMQKKASEEITSQEQFNNAYPPPHGCGGSASGVSLGLALVPLAARRKREE